MLCLTGQLWHAKCSKIQSPIFQHSNIIQPSIQRHHSTFKDSIQHSTTSFNIQRHHSTFNDIIQHSTTSFNIQRLHSTFNDFIQHSTTPFNIQQFHNIQQHHSFNIQRHHSTFNGKSNVTFNGNGTKHNVLSRIKTLHVYLLWVELCRFLFVDI